MCKASIFFFFAPLQKSKLCWSIKTSCHLHPAILPSTPFPPMAPFHFLVSVATPCCIPTSEDLELGTPGEREHVTFIFLYLGCLFLILFVCLKTSWLHCSLQLNSIPLNKLYWIFIIYSSVNRHLVCCCFLVIVNKTAMNIADQVSVVGRHCLFISRLPRSEIIIETVLNKILLSLLA